jgi:iodotyrosine deiodinase
MGKYNFKPLNFIRYSEKDMLKKSASFLKLIKQRRSVRDFSEQDVDPKIIENAIAAAGSAPSGANLQPWHFVAVSSKDIKKQIQIAAEKEEKEFYGGRAPESWLEDLEPLGTDEFKPFLEKAPYLIVIFEKKYDKNEEGGTRKFYYTKESAGIACGMLITALHVSGLATLTHTPSPMNFLNKILNRPSNEKPYLILVTGYPADNCKVPDIKKRDVNDIISFL